MIGVRSIGFVVELGMTIAGGDQRGGFVSLAEALGCPCAANDVVEACVGGIEPCAVVGFNISVVWSSDMARAKEVL